MTDTYPRPDQPEYSGDGRAYQPSNNPSAPASTPASTAASDSDYQMWSAANHSANAGGPYGYGQPGGHQTSWLPPATGHAAAGLQGPGHVAPRRSAAWRVGVSAAAAAGLLAAAMTGFGAGVLLSNSGTDEASVRITGDGLPQVPVPGQSGAGTQTLPDPNTQLSPDSSGPDSAGPDSAGSDSAGSDSAGSDSAGSGGQGASDTLPDGSPAPEDSSAGGWSIPGMPDIPGLPDISGLDIPGLPDISGLDIPGLNSEEDGGGQDSFGGGSSGSSSQGLSEVAQAAAARVTPSVVNIDVNVGYGAGSGAGTGMVLTADGKVLTNAHVISGGSQIKGTVVGNRKTYPITVLGYDKTRDVALVQLEGASGLTPAAVDNADDVKVGDLVVGVGNAGGEGGDPTSVAGRVTETGATITASDADGRNSETLHNLIGADAKIQPGQSGGPMVDSDGEVIGMNTAASVGGGFSGPGQSTGYAIPINDALAIANQINAGQASETIHVGPTAFLGVQVSDASGDGVTIAGVVAGSAAENAGLARGDKIVSIDSDAITTPEGLSAKIREHKAGDRITVIYVDGSGARKSVSVTLGSGPAA